MLARPPRAAQRLTPRGVSPPFLRRGGAAPAIARAKPSRVPEVIRGTVKRCSFTGWLTARPGAGLRMLVGRGRPHRLPRTILLRCSAAGRAGGGSPGPGAGGGQGERRVRAGTATTSRELAGALLRASRPDSRVGLTVPLLRRALTPASPRGRGGGTREDALTPALCQGERGRDASSPDLLGHWAGWRPGRAPHAAPLQEKALAESRRPAQTAGPRDRPPGAGGRPWRRTMHCRRRDASLLRALQ